jgi:hypothetical protein
MPDVPALPDRYSALIEQIVQMTLKGQIRSKDQVYQMLQEGVSVGTGEIFERCLDDRLTETQRQAETQTDELKQAKATRSLRALQTIRSEWERWQTQNQATAALDTVIQQLITTEESRLTIFLRATDPNLAKPLSLAQWQQLAKRLRSFPEMGDTSATASELQQIAQGILRSLEDWAGFTIRVRGRLALREHRAIEDPGQPGPSRSTVHCRDRYFRP